MATFYLLPSRSHLSRQWARYFHQWFPGLADAGPELAEALKDAAGTVEELVRDVERGYKRPLS